LACSGRSQIFENIFPHDFIREQIDLRVRIVLIGWKVIKIRRKGDQVRLKDRIVLHTVIQTAQLEIFHCENDGLVSNTLITFKAKRLPIAAIISSFCSRSCWEITKSELITTKMVSIRA
jgi:hypothetical protein